MTFDREQLREIFFEALERTGPDQCAYLDEACGSEESLRREVDSLLAHHDDAPLVEDGGDPVRALAGTAPTVAGGSRAPLQAAADGGRPRYRTLRELGAGGFGVVVERFDSSLRRAVASKSPLVAETAHEAALLREARLLAYLDHPGVVQVYDLGEDGTGVSYTMELLEGESLSTRLTRLRAEGRLMAVSEALRIATRVCETVANAHDKGVVHLDVKPDNVMLQPFGHVSLIDWGMARFHDPEPYRQHLARAGETHSIDLLSGELSGGTPAYMPPEQFESGAQLGPAADIYNIGAMLFESLTTSRPFGNQNDVGRILQAKLQAAPHIRDLRPELSQRLAAICSGMLAPSPEDRPASLTEVLEDLAALANVGEGTELQRIEPSVVLFEQGAESTNAYQIISGELEILVGHEVVATRGAGDVVGELAMLSRSRRSATVRARTASVVRAIDWTALENELSRVDPLVGRLLRNLSDKLIETTRK